MTKKELFVQALNNNLKYLIIEPLAETNESTPHGLYVVYRREMWHAMQCCSVNWRCFCKRLYRTKTKIKRLITSKICAKESNSLNALIAHARTLSASFRQPCLNPPHTDDSRRPGRTLASRDKSRLVIQSQWWLNIARLPARHRSGSGETGRPQSSVSSDIIYFIDSSFLLPINSYCLNIRAVSSLVLSNLEFLYSTLTA